MTLKLVTRDGEKVASLPGQPEFILLSGLPASGKSTRAAAWQAEDPDGRVVINYDTFRLARYGEDWKFNWKEEGEMKAAARAVADQALKAGLSVLIDNLNLTERHREPWLALAKEYGLTPTFEDIKTDTHTCVVRDRLRSGRARVGRGVIDGYALHNGLINWDEELPQLAHTARDIVLLDLDGTLCDNNHRIQHILKKPKDWDAFHAACDKDRPYPIIHDLVDTLAGFHYIIVVTGRGNEWGTLTDEWLTKHKVYPKFLFMRKAGDKRDDFIIKGEVLDLLPFKRIAFALEDRDQVVKMYRERGVTTLQVRDGNF